jgi:hypothetical protein
VSDNVTEPEVHGKWQGCGPMHHTCDCIDSQIEPALDTVRTSLVISTRIVRLWVMGLVAPAMGRRSAMDAFTPSGAADAEMLSVMLPASKSSWTVGLVICSQHQQGQGRHTHVIVCPSTARACTKPRCCGRPSESSGHIVFQQLRHAPACLAVCDDKQMLQAPQDGQTSCYCGEG